MNSQGRIMPASTYPQSTNSEFGDYWWLPTWQYRPDLIGGDSRFVNQQGAVSNIWSPHTTPTTEGEQDAASWHFLGNQQNATVLHQQAVPDNLPEQVWPPPHHPPNSTVSAVRVDLMNVEQTAAWIRTLSLFNGWEEADQYSQSFQQNGIWGHLLWKLTLNSLKLDLGIKKYGHRLEIKVAIKRLYPSLLGQDGGEESNMIDKNRSNMSDTASETDSGRLEGYTVPTPKSFNSSLYQSTEHDMTFPTGERSPRNSPVAVSSCVTLRSDDQNKKALNTNEKPLTSQPKIDNRSTQNYNKAVKWHSSKATPTEVLSFSVRRKSTRARPDNPVEYKTLRNAKIRSGKSVRTDGVGYLQKGSVVVINQIKGRSGRVVHPQRNGEFIKVGWVTLYTHDGQQLLEKVTCKRTMMRNKA